MACAGGGNDSEQGTHQCEMNSEGIGKPFLDSNSCLENPLLDLQESEQTRRTTTTKAIPLFPLWAFVAGYRVTYHLCT
jgi:hypothetical protein